MKALLDENLAQRLARRLRDRGCDVAAFPNSWKGTKNGRLLDRMIDNGFACLITADKNLAFQQSTDERTVCVLVLPSPRFGDLEPIMDDIARAIASMRSGTV